MNPPPGYFQLQGIDPRTGSSAHYRIEIDRLSQLRKYHSGRKADDAMCVKVMVQSFYAAFEGLRAIDAKFGDPADYVREPDKNGLCICGIPNRRWSLTGETPPPPGYTFCVFADSRLVVSNWAWIKSDPSDPRLPIGHSSIPRFDKQIWPNSLQLKSS